MKTTLVLLASVVLATVARAEFRKWTNSDGKVAELNLLQVVDEGGEKVGEFTMRNGRRLKLPASSLVEADAAILRAWTPAGETTEAAARSAFFPLLDGDLLKLDNGSLKRLDEFKEPKKYYLFYYTASWCPPCRAFTPTLVDWYNTNKNDNFELVLITSDRDEGAMESYAKEKKMPWPQLKMRKVADFRQKFDHGVSGIPSLIVCDVEGKMIGTFRSRLAELAQMVKD